MAEKNKILEFSRDKFLSEGFYKITMDEIAGGLRISKKTIYKYFSSKNILVEGVIRLVKKILKKQLDDISAVEGNSIIKIKKLTNFFAELSFQINPKMLNDLKTYRPDLWKEIDEFRTKNIKRFWKKIIEQGKKEGYIIDYPSELMLEIMIGAMQRIINPTFILNNNLSIQKAFEITFGILINGLLTEKGKKVYKEIQKGTENENIF